MNSVIILLLIVIIIIVCIVVYKHFKKEKEIAQPETFDPPIQNQPPTNYYFEDRNDEVVEEKSENVFDQLDPDLIAKNTNKIYDNENLMQEDKTLNKTKENKPVIDIKHFHIPGMTDRNIDNQASIKNYDKFLGFNRHKINGESDVTEGEIDESKIGLLQKSGKGKQLLAATFKPRIPLALRAMGDEAAGEYIKNFESTRVVNKDLMNNIDKIVEEGKPKETKTKEKPKKKNKK